jgi:hypothetical protein
MNFLPHTYGSLLWGAMTVNLFMVEGEIIREAHVTLNDPKCAADAAEDKARTCGLSTGFTRRLNWLNGIDAERMAAVGHTPLMCRRISRSCSIPFGTPCDQ